jgi:hypothetical protein
METRLAAASGGLAEARILRPGAAPVIDLPAHAGALVFSFVLEGTARLEFEGRHPLGPADAFTLPPREAWRLAEMSGEFRLLHVTTSGRAPQ